jgi:hypothetical protein
VVAPRDDDSQLASGPIQRVLDVDRHT